MKFGIIRLLFNNRIIAKRITGEAELSALVESQQITQQPPKIFILD